MCSKTVYPTEKVLALKKSWHKACFRCTTCKGALPLGKEDSHDGMPYCKRCHQANFGPGGYGFGSAVNSHSWNTDVHTASGAVEPPAPSKFCSSCGGATQIGQKFCAGCGAAV